MSSHKSHPVQPIAAPAILIHLPSGQFNLTIHTAGSAHLSGKLRLSGARQHTTFNAALIVSHDEWELCTIDVEGTLPTANAICEKLKNTLLPEFILWAGAHRRLFRMAGLIHSHKSH